MNIHLIRRIYYRLKVANASLRKSKFGIKRGYLHRNEVQKFDDSNLKDEYQQEVYLRAVQVYHEHNLHGVLDFGCGSGYKLMKYFENASKAGVELDISYLKKIYPKEQWFAFNDSRWENYDAQLLLCSDVIEHVEDPDKLMQQLSRLHQIKYFIFSTPDRNLDMSPWKYGPPNNECHYREWTFEEFGAYVAQYFKVLEHTLTNPVQRTQMVICCSRH